MKKLFDTLCLLVIGLMAALPAAAQVAQGDIDLQQVNSNPSNPTGICQCDTIEVRYEIKPGAAFASTSTFEYQLASYSPPPPTPPTVSWGSSTNINLVDLLVSKNPNVSASNINDTIGPGVKWAVLAVPCNAQLLGQAFRIVNKDNTGSIVADGVSDTAFYNINRIPTVAKIDSVRLLRNGALQDTFENPYTASQQDVGFCVGDSVVLFASGDGTQYIWERNGTPLINAPQVDSLIVGSSGTYRCEIKDGPCSIKTPEVKVSSLNTSQTITWNSNDARNAGSFDISRSIVNGGNGLLDSIEFCEDKDAVLDGPQPPQGTGLTYTYQWLSDSINPTSGQPIKYTLKGRTNFELALDDSIAPPGIHNFYVVIDDGLCLDTTEAFVVIVDSIPDGDLISPPFPGNPGDTSFLNVCMTDSVQLQTLPSVPDPTWKYSWEWLDPTTGTWLTVSGKTGNQRSFDTLPTLSVDTSLSDPGQPYFQSPKPLIRYFRVRLRNRTTTNKQVTCSAYSDTMVVRWRPVIDMVALAPGQPQVSTVGQDSINFCETDSAIIQGPVSPTELDTNGFPYTYQWLTDSLNPNSGNRVKYALTGETNRRLTVDSSGHYFLVLDDGICRDTSAAFEVFVDSLPRTAVQEVPFPGQTSVTNLNLCLYDSALVSATDTFNTGLRPWDYQWQQYNPIQDVWSNLPGDSLVAFQIDTSYQRVNEDTAYFRLVTQYRNQFGIRTCEYVADSVQAIFYEAPNVSYIPSDSVGICPGDSVLFVAQGNFTSFSWQNGQVLSASRYIKNPGNYPVEATGVNGCITYDTVEVTSLVVNAAIGPDITAASGEVVTLQAFGGTDFRWFASDPIQFSSMRGQSIKVSNTLPDGVDADTARIFVEVTNTRGCVGLDSLLFIVNREDPPDAVNLNSKAYNVITPNGDGLNDIWDIRELVDGDDCKLTILNRWGSTVYEEESFSGTWTGVDNGGNELDDGTYYYILDCGGTVRMRNALTILRSR
ncbi:MAG: gliding motility-associated C-terminal domain-containing protein [Schleiferiaceae bacterium]|nr:gliding motility-associated C-terminal domain-containing protein [Schleiferiaceae bacterium]